MDWTQVSVKVDGEAAEAVAEVLRPFAHGGVSLEQVATDIDVRIGRPKLESQVTVSIYFPQEEDNDKKRRRIEEIIWHLGQLYPIPEPTFQIVREQDWANAWKEHYKAFRVGEHFLICPAWQKVNVGAQDILLLMDPGMAFGTGLHPTTRMCLEVLETYVHKETSVLDLGTGSGILSIAAAKLGASPIRAIDIDAVAVRSAQQNSLTNSVDDRIRISEGSLSDLEVETWDVVVANILAPVILDMIAQNLERFIKLGGILVLSGIIDTQVPDILKAMEKHEIELVESRHVKDWVTLVGRR